MAGTNRNEYIIPKGNNATGRGDYKRSIPEQGSLFIAETPIAKLYLILLMVIYGVIVYSKGKNGVENDDVSLLVFFSLFVIVSISCVELLTMLKRKFDIEIKSAYSIREAIKNLFSRYFVPVFFVIGLLISLGILAYYSGKFIAEILNTVSHIVR
jgi:hypothetical protein